VVKVIGGGAELKEGRGGRKLLRIKITAEVDGVRREYTITFGRCGKRGSGTRLRQRWRPRRQGADAERFSALVETLTGVKPRTRRRSDGKIVIECYREHLEGFMRYTELAKAIKRWLEETSRQ
jgi:hypothetical protein